MRLPFTLLTLGFATAAPALADRLDLAEIPADARWVAHLDAEAFHDSRVGAEIYALWIESDESAGPRLVADLFGVDLGRDLKSVTLFDDAYREGGQTTLIDADFDEARVLGLVAYLPEYGVETLDGVAVRSWWDEERGRTAFGAVEAGRIVVAAAAEDVAAAVRVLRGDADDARSRGDAFVFADADAVLAVGLDRPPVETLPEAIDVPDGVGPIGVSIAERDEVVRIDARLSADGESADRAEAVLRGVIAFGTLLDAGESLKAALLRELAGAASVTRSETGLTVRTGLPITTLLDAAGR